MKHVVITLLVLLTATLSWAQTAEGLPLKESRLKTEAQIPKVSDPVEKLQVTGSYIRRTDVEGPSPIETIDEEQFALTGTTSVEDVLRESAVFSGFNGDGSVYFRGQHSANMLILINGLRLPKAGNFFNSIRSLPANVLQKIEVLKDGSSATYGSDALSGVVNFITKKDTDGSYVSTSFLAPENGVGQEQNHLATFGKSFSRGNIMGVVQYRKTEDFFEADLGSENFNPSSAAKNRTSSGSLTSNNEAFNGQQYGEPCAAGVCSTDPNLLEQVRPDVTEIGTMLTGAYELGTNWDVSGVALYTRNERRFNRGAPGDLSINNVNVSDLKSTALQQQTAGLSPSDQVSLSRYSPLLELGPAVGNTIDDNVIAQAQGTRYINDSWNVKLEGGYGLTESNINRTGGDANTQMLGQMFRDGTFVPGANSDLSAAQVNSTLRFIGQSTNLRAITSGELFNVGSAPMSMAVGIEGQWEDVRENHDAIASSDLLLSGALPPNGATDRGVRSGFLELAAYPVETLELQLAGRFDSYTDVGETFNPKVAVAYKPAKQILFRSSLGTGFRAPGVWDLVERRTERISRDFDGDVVVFNDQNLEPERGITYNIGTIIEPTKGLSFTIDQWNYEGRDVLTSPNDSEFLENPGSFNADINQDPSGNVTSLVRPRLVNIGRRVFRGVDVGAAYNFKLKNNIQVGLSSNHTYTYRLNEVRGIASPEVRYGGRWKNTTSAFMGFGNHLTRFAAKTVSQINDSRLDRTGSLPAYTEYDVTYAYTAPWNGKFSFTVKNIFDGQPPVRNNPDGRNFGDLRFDYTAFSPLRRRAFMSYSQTF